MATEFHVYRVEDSYGNGPYGWGANKSLHRHEDLFQRGGPLECDCDKHPGPKKDFQGQAYQALAEMVSYHSEVAFGFKTKEQFQRWFGKSEIEAIVEFGDGFGVATYQTTHIVQGQHQVAFSKIDAIRIQWRVLQRDLEL